MSFLPLIGGIGIRYYGFPFEHYFATIFTITVAFYASVVTNSVFQLGLLYRLLILYEHSWPMRRKRNLFLLLVPLHHGVIGNTLTFGLAYPRQEACRAYFAYHVTNSAECLASGHILLMLHRDISPWWDVTYVGFIIGLGIYVVNNSIIITLTLRRIKALGSLMSRVARARHLGALYALLLQAVMPVIVYIVPLILIMTAVTSNKEIPHMQILILNLLNNILPKMTRFDFEGGTYYFTETPKNLTINLEIRRIIEPLYWSVLPLSIFINLLGGYCIVKKSTKDMGRYKWFLGYIWIWAFIVDMLIALWLQPLSFIPLTGGIGLRHHGFWLEYNEIYMFGITLLAFLHLQVVAALTTYSMSSVQQPAARAYLAFHVLNYQEILDFGHNLMLLHGDLNPMWDTTNWAMNIGTGIFMVINVAVITQIFRRLKQIGLLMSREAFRRHMKTLIALLCQALIPLATYIIPIIIILAAVKANYEGDYLQAASCYIIVLMSTHGALNSLVMICTLWAFLVDIILSFLIQPLSFMPLVGGTGLRHFRYSFESDEAYLFGVTVFAVVCINLCEMSIQVGFVYRLLLLYERSWPMRRKRNLFLLLAFLHLEILGTVVTYSMSRVPQPAAKAYLAYHLLNAQEFLASNENLLMLHGDLNPIHRRFPIHHYRSDISNISATKSYWRPDEPRDEAKASQNGDSIDRPVVSCYVIVLMSSHGALNSLVMIATVASYRHFCKSVMRKFMFSSTLMGHGALWAFFVDIILSFWIQPLSFMPLVGGMGLRNFRYSFESDEAYLFGVTVFAMLCINLCEMSIQVGFVYRLLLLYERSWPMRKRRNLLLVLAILHLQILGTVVTYSTSRVPQPAAKAYVAYAITPLTTYIIPIVVIMAAMLANYQADYFQVVSCYVIVLMSSHGALNSLMMIATVASYRHFCQSFVRKLLFSSTLMGHGALWASLVDILISFWIQPLSFMPMTGGIAIRNYQISWERSEAYIFGCTLQVFALLCINLCELSIQLGFVYRLLLLYEHTWAMRRTRNLIMLLMVFHLQVVGAMVTYSMSSVPQESARAYVAYHVLNAADILAINPKLLMLHADLNPMWDTTMFVMNFGRSTAIFMVINGVVIFKIFHRLKAIGFLMSRVARGRHLRTVFALLCQAVIPFVTYIIPIVAILTAVRANYQGDYLQTVSCYVIVLMSTHGALNSLVMIATVASYRHFCKAFLRKLLFSSTIMGHGAASSNLWSRTDSNNQQRN
ncbi:unnamed protein product, partial [Mesorhabditis spiculigera]